VCNTEGFAFQQRWHKILAQSLSDTTENKSRPGYLHIGQVQLHNSDDLVARLQAKGFKVSWKARTRRRDNILMKKFWMNEKICGGHICLRSVMKG
jgi:hypothetical protein